MQSPFTQNNLLQFTLHFHGTLLSSGLKKCNLQKKGRSFADAVHKKCALGCDRSLISPLERIINVWWHLSNLGSEPEKSWHLPIRPKSERKNKTCHICIAQDLKKPLTSSIYIFAYNNLLYAVKSSSTEHGINISKS